MISFQLSFLVLAAFVAASCALDCYVCRFMSVGNVSPDCKGPNVNSSFLMTCPNDTTHCVEQSTSASIIVTTLLTLDRSCSSMPPNTGCINAVVGTVCTNTCQTDGCNTGNGAGNTEASFAAFIVSTAIAIMLAML